MSKEQPHLRGSGPVGAPSSKNAKDKRNSTTLSAIREAKDGDGSNRRGSSCSSEKDSGYSDGSDWQQTDVEDQRSTKSQPRETEKPEAPQAGQAKVPGGTNTGMPTKSAPPPLYIIKQPATTQERSQSCAAKNVTISNRTVSPHMIILEQPRLVPAPLQLLQPSRAPDKKANSTYLPISNSYPRIAPHPTKKPPDRSSSKQESQSSSKRMCTERKTEDASVARGSSEEHRHKQPKSTNSNSISLSSASSRNRSSSTFTISSNNPGSPSISSPHAVPSGPPDWGSQRRITPSSHHRRFLNTVELLRRSGLLDITLRTKESLRQSNSTEQDISQLRRHTELLCQAVSSPGQSPNGVAAWELVCQAMAESGCYPNSKMNQQSQNPSHLDPISQTQSISSGNMNIQQAAEGSCSSEQAQVKRNEKSEPREGAQDKVTLMSPDSSTG